MSASREKRMRNQQATSVAPAQQPKKKISEGWILAISVVVIFALVIGGIMFYRNAQNNKTVLTVGEHEVTVKEFNYHYASVANQMSSYISMFGIESGIALDEQYVDQSTAESWGYVMGETPAEELTWAHVFAYSAMQSAAQTYAFYDDAMANGFADDHVSEEVEATIAEAEAAAEEEGLSLQEWLERLYGSAADEESYREYLRVSYIASHYSSELSSSKEYTAEELNARFEESPEDFTYASYYNYTITAADFVEASEDGETAAEPTKVEQNQAEEAAKAMEADFDVEDENVSVNGDRSRTSAAGSLSEEAVTWLFDEAEKDAVKLFVSEDGNTYNVLKLIDKEDYQTVNALTITIDEDAEEPAEGEMTAEEKIAAITASLEADPSEENFRKLLEEYPNENSTGELSAWGRSSMTSVSDEAMIWASVEERTAGDYGVFETTGSTKIIFFLGYEKSYRDGQLNTTLISEYLNDLYEAAIAACGYDEEAAMLANVDLAYNG